MSKKLDPKKVAYREAVKDFRNKYIDELDKTMKFFISVRDNEAVSVQERNKAGIAIGKMLGSWQPDREPAKKEEKKKEEAPFTPAVEKEINQRLASVLGDSWTGKTENT